MATPTIPNGETQFFPIIYEGNGGGQRVGKFVPFTDNGTIANSVIFNSPDDPKLGKTFSGAGTEETWTFSCWIKLGIDTSNGRRMIFSAGSAGSNFGGAELSSTGDNSLEFYNYVSGSYAWRLQTNRKLEDRSKWYHLLFVSDTTNSTESDRARIYIDGDRITSFATESYPSLNYANNFWMGTTEHEIGTSIFTTQNFDGYMAEVNNIDGSVVLPSTFGLVDTSSGRWIPKTLSGITYGTNGFRLKFQDSSSLGDDTSGNTNDFTATNLASTDQTTDSPTQNHSTLQGTGGTLSEGNLKLVTGNSDYSHHNATLKPKSGKYYAEFTCNSMGRSEVGIASTTKLPYSANNVRLPATDDGSLAGIMWYGFNGNYSFDSGFSTIVSGTSYTTNDIIGIALDLDNLNVKFYKNNTLDKTFNIPNSNYTFAMGDGATGFGGGWTANFGQKSFTYNPETGFVALQQDNLPETAKGISGLVWTKNRDATDNHQLYDSSRGKQLVLASNATSAESTVTDGLQRFLAGGQQIEDSDAINTSGESFVTWNWVANGGTTATNNDGSQTSTTQANTTSGFSIVTYAGTSSGTATIGHSLAQTPQWIVIKNLTDSRSWFVYHKDLSGANYYLSLNSNSGQSTSDVFNNTAPTSSVFSIQDAGSLNTNGSGKNYLALCWHGVEGFSKFGSYRGSGSSDGTFIHLNFTASFIMIKEIGNSNDWVIWDSARFPLNPTNNSLFANLTQGDNGSSIDLDVLSNGFKCRTTNSQINRSGGSYIYMAFAKVPFANISPATAR